MKLGFIVGAGFGVLLFSGCGHVSQGTNGTSSTETGFAHAEDGTPNAAAARTSPLGRSGLTEETRAASRAEAGLEVSGSGSAELARRSAAATVEAPAGSSVTPAPSATGNVRNAGDELLLNKIHSALSSPDPRPAPFDQALSIQDLNNLRISVEGGVATLRGRVEKLSDREAIEQRILGVEGIQRVKNELEVRPETVLPTNR